MFLSVKKYKFDLDLPESKRWIRILDDNKDKLPKIKNMINDILIQQKITGVLYTMIASLINHNKKKIMYYDEIACIAKKINIEFPKMLIMQLMYESSSACTSIVTKVNDKNVFIRTMDWDMDILKELTITLQITKNNNIICIAPTWIGCVGLFTGITHNYAIAINYRRTKNISIMSSINNITKLSNMYWPASYLLRYTCEKGYNITSAEGLLSKSNIVSPCYYTLFNKSGPSYLITRDSTSCSVIKSDNIVQTNCDQDKTTPDILYSVERRNIIKKSIKKNNNNYKSLDVFLEDVLIHPIVNNETVFITMIDDTNKISTIVIK